MDETHDPDQTADISSEQADSRDGRRTEPPRSVLGSVPVHLKESKGESGHSVEPTSDAMPSMEDTGDRYQLSGEIARGGMGAVLRGRDIELGRDLAVKVLLTKYLKRPETVRRFIDEAQIGGQLQHPGVVPIYDIGHFGDRPFFTMKLVKGATLAKLLSDRADPADDRPRFLAIALQVAQALAYTHSKGVIHRDLKPANIMVGSFGEVQVMDWGLAKVLADGRGDGTDSPSQPRQEAEDAPQIRTARRSGSTGSFGTETEAGALLGTPAYMPPEQANGDVALLDQRADVFGLGAILCEILTTQPPYAGRSAKEVHRKAALGDLAEATARLDECGADGDLIALTKSCLASELIDRPRDAQAVADALTEHLDGVEDRLRQAELAGVEERARRRVTTVVAASLLVLSVTGGLGFTYWLQQRQAGEARVALAFKEATLLRDQAMADPQDLARWPAALEGLKRAETALVDFGDRATRQQLARLKKEIRSGAATANRDRVLVEQLIDIRTAHANDYDSLKMDTAYAAAFRAAGIDVDTLDPSVAGERIAARPESVRMALVSALDHWTAMRKARGVPGESWPHLVAVVRVADPDPDRDALRSAITDTDRARRVEKIRPLVERADVQNWPPASLALLASALAVDGYADDGVRILRRATGVHPTDVWIHYSLGLLLENTTPPRRQEAIEAYAAARAIRPETGHVFAHSLERIGRPKEAEAVFRDLVLRRPESTQHLLCLGRHLNEQKRSDEALPFLERALATGRKAVELAPESLSARIMLGQTLQAMGQYDEVIAIYRKLITLDPKSRGVRSALAIALEKKGQTVEAVAEYRKAIELDPTDVDNYYNLGHALQTSGQIDAAISEYRKAIAIDPRLSEPHINLGKALHDKGMVDEAISEYQLAIEIDPNVAGPHSQLGAAFCDDKEDYERAMACFLRAIELAPDYADAHYNLGRVLTAKGQVDEAIAACRTAIQLEPEMIQAHVNLAHLLQVSGQIDEAIAECHAALLLDANFAKAHAILGDALAAKGQFDKAIAEYRMAIELEPNNAKPHKQLGIVLCDIKREYKAAIASFRTAIELDPTDARTHFNIGLALKANGLNDAAVAEWQTAIKLDASLVEAHYNLGNELSAQGRIDEAIVEFRTAIKLAPNVASTHYNLANMLNAQGKSHEAITEYRETVRLKPDFAEAHCNMGNSLRNNGLFAESLVALRRGHELGSMRPGWPYPSAEWVRSAEAVVVLDGQLTAFLNGTFEPKDNSERLALVTVCRIKKLYRTSARLYADAFAAEPMQSDLAHNRYNAACVAAQAGCGQGNDATADAAERAQLRSHALNWLKGSLELMEAQLASGTTTAKADALARLRHSQTDSDLNGVRDESELAKLPAEEREKFVQLWADVAELLDKAEPPPVSHAPATIGGS